MNGQNNIIKFFYFRDKIYCYYFVPVFGSHKAVEEQLHD